MQEHVSSELMSQKQKLPVLLSEEPYMHGLVRFGHLEACNSINFVDMKSLSYKQETRTMPMPMESQKKA